MASALSIELLLEAYSNGYFPMGDEKTGEIGWYRPDPRALIPLDGFHCSRSLQKTLKRNLFGIQFDNAFGEVMKCCAQRKETWISEEFIAAYGKLFELGFAHSVETWRDGKLVGGAYGVTIGGAFFAESMFHFETDASKVALYYLVQKLNEQNFSLLEVQFLTPHLKSLGAIVIPDHKYLLLLKNAINQKVAFF